MFRELLPFVESSPPYLRGFHCTRCAWSYMRPEQEVDDLEFISDARELFCAHECDDYRLDGLPFVVQEGRSED